MGSALHQLDYNQLYGLALTYDSATQKLSVTIETNGMARPRFTEALRQLVHLKEKNPDPPPKGKKSPNTLTFSNVARDFTLYLGKEAIGSYTITNRGDLTSTFHRPLTVDETRRIGTFHQCEPYPQQRPGESETLLKTAKSAVFTDFHTHSSGQISAQGLLDVAMQSKKPYFYPIALLTEAGISTSYNDITAKNRQNIPRVPFPPKERVGETYPEMVEAADLHQLSKDDLKKLAARMTLPADHQSTFTNLEYDGNRFRYPLSKDRSLTRAIRMKEAEEYAAQGIQFALTSYVGLDDPQTLRTIHETVEATQTSNATRNFSQRYMLGIPRGFPLPKIAEMLEKAKVLLDSPYIVGVDILGYETNKTKEFVKLLDDYARWANEHKPGSFIRVHAGENDKNHDNVKDFLKIAVKYPHLKFLVGHGLYGMDEETQKLAKKLCKNPENPQLTVEYNPSSNIALNNIDDLQHVPFTMALENNIPFIVGSDAAGMYQTDATQLGLAAYYAGLTEQGFEKLHAHQNYLLTHVQAYSEKVAASIPQWQTPEGKEAHLQDISRRLAAVPRADIPAAEKTDEAAIEAKLKEDRVTLIAPRNNPPELQNKCPITIVGASGASWKRLSKGQQRENAIAIDMLVHALGENCYLVQGRNKKSGLSKVLNQSLRETNEIRKEAGKKPLYSVGMHINPRFDDTHSYKHLTHMVRVDGQALDLANAIVDYTFEHEGVLIAVGGAAFTRDIILEADQRGIHDSGKTNQKMLLLLGNTAGASGDKSTLLHPDYKAMDGRNLIKKLFETRRELFPRDFKLTNLNTLYNASAARVDAHGYHQAEPPEGKILHLASAAVTVPSSPKKVRGG